VWREIMGVGDDNVPTALKSLLRGEKDDWGLDESLASRKLLAWPRFASSCQLIPRGWQNGANHRLDRAYWKLPADLSSLIDCHSARPLLPHWDVIEQLATRFLPAPLLAQAQAYIATLRG
jgi:hypothetical protein